MIVKGFPTIVLCPFQVKYDEILWGLSVGARLSPVKVGRTICDFYEWNRFLKRNPLWTGVFWQIFHFHDCRRMWKFTFYHVETTDECWLGTMNFAPECFGEVTEIQTSGTPQRHVFFYHRVFIASNMYNGEFWILNTFQAILFLG